MTQCSYLVVLASGILVGCGGQAKVGSVDPGPAKQEQVIRADSASEPSAEQTARFLATVKTLKVGDSYDQVVKLLGVPQEEALLCGKGQNDPVKGISVKYLLRKVRRNSSAEGDDEVVSLIFTNDKRLKSIESSLDQVDPFRK